MAMRRYLGVLRGRTIGVLTAVLFIVASAAATSSAAGRLPQHDHQAPAETADEHSGTAPAPDMMAMRQQMKAEHSAADARLRLLVEQMNTATGQARVDAMAAVVIELVAERSSMRAHMDRMSAMPERSEEPSDMRTKMAEHCPMMKGTATPATP
jgi:hypothetical protein